MQKLQMAATILGGIVLFGLIALALPEKGEHELHQEEEKADAIAVSIAATLFGSVSVIMMLYYLLHWPAPNIRKYSYETLSATISIFCAVLLFQSLQDFIDEFFLKSRSAWVVISVNLVHRMAWHLALQIALANICRVTSQAKKREEVMYNYGAIKDIEVELKCWGLLLAHINGFAAINLFGSIQHLPFFASSLLHSSSVLIISLAFQFALLYVTDLVRERLIRGDGTKDKLEVLWDREAEEAENVVMALTQSFLAVQTVRFAISGNLPDVEGEEEARDVFSHPVLHSVLLFAFGLSCLAAFAGVVYGLKGSRSQEEEENEREEEDELGDTGYIPTYDSSQRGMEVALMCFGMGTAWSVFFAAQWGLASACHWDEDMTLLTVVLAVSISICSFAMIWVLDWLARQDWTGPACDRILFELVGIIGILIGLSWERNFESAVRALASQTERPILMKLPLSAFCTLLIVPAWKWYMLPMIVHQGWRFGFVASHATQCLDNNDKESVGHYLELVKHFSTCGEHAVRAPMHRDIEHVASVIGARNRVYVLL